MHLPCNIQYHLVFSWTAHYTSISVVKQIKVEQERYKMTFEELKQFVEKHKDNEQNEIINAVKQLLEKDEDFLNKNIQRKDTISKYNEAEFSRMQPPLFYVLESNAYNIAKVFIDNGAHADGVNIWYDKKTENLSNFPNYIHFPSLLESAAMRDDLRAAILLLDNGANPRIRGIDFFKVRLSADVSLRLQEVYDHEYKFKHCSKELKELILTASLTQEINSYIRDRNKEIDYHIKFTLFDTEFNFGPISKQDKIDAANAVLSVLSDQAEKTTLTDHTQALSQGRLGDLLKKYQEELPILPLNETVSIPITPQAEKF